MGVLELILLSSPCHSHNKMKVLATVFRFTRSLVVLVAWFCITESIKIYIYIYIYIYNYYSTLCQCSKAGFGTWPGESFSSTSMCIYFGLDGQSQDMHAVSLLNSHTSYL